MNTHDIYAFCALALFFVSVALAMRAGWRLIVIRITREHRLHILKAATLLEEKSVELTEAEARSLSIAVNTLYSYKAKTLILKLVLKHREDIAGHRVEPMRAEIEEAMKGFAAICLAENPVLAVKMLIYATSKKQRDTKAVKRGDGPIVRVERVVAAQVSSRPRMNVEDDLAIC